MPEWAPLAAALAVTVVFGVSTIYGWLRFDTYLNRRLEEAE